VHDVPAQRAGLPGGQSAQEAKFTIPQVLTGGGPANATLTLNLYIYDLAFQNFQFSMASSAALFAFAITQVLTLMTLRLTRIQWSY